jgi:hypothetical protein
LLFVNFTNLIGFPDKAMAATPSPEQALSPAIFVTEDFFIHRWHLPVAASFTGSPGSRAPHNQAFFTNGPLFRGR